MKNLILLGASFFILLACGSDDSSNPDQGGDDKVSADCLLQWTQTVKDSAIIQCVSSGSSESECSCFVDKASEEFTVCDFNDAKNSTKIAELALTCEVVMDEPIEVPMEACDLEWNQTTKDAAIAECISDGTSKEACTCTIDAVSKEFTLCELSDEKNSARLIAISLGCGVVEIPTDGTPEVCNLEWNQTTKDVAIAECVLKGASQETCVCAIDKASTEFTLCEFNDPMSINRLAEITESCVVVEDSPVTEECELKWDQSARDQLIADCVSGGRDTEVCTCTINEISNQLTLCELEDPENIDKVTDIGVNCGFVGAPGDDCNVDWNQVIKDAAIAQCISVHNNREGCICSVNETANQLTICETQTAEGIAKQLQISLACGITPVRN